MFPRLKERENTPAGVLSGGEQQMLTLCRTLMGDPDLVLIDEPTEASRQ
jgi:branched-chain amino acid transport system ATP-binding protein